MNSKKQAFTLVELIVVITILAILATVGFVSFSGYLAWARDTNRIAQLKSMSDALELYRTKKDLPIPDDKVDVTASGTTIAYQWYIWANVLETIEYTEKGLDPKDKNYFSYYLTKNKKHFQLLSFLEEASEDTLAWNNIFNTSQAVDYSERVPHVKWKKLWILTDGNNTPIQDISTISSNGSIDLYDVWTTTYKAIISDDEFLSWTWTSLSSAHRTWSCKRIKQVKWWTADWVYTIDPEWNGVWFEVYCDMERDWWWWTLVGVSWTTAATTALNFLDWFIAPISWSIGYESDFSVDASQITFSEVAMWIWEEQDKYYWFFVTDGFDNSRAFESTASWTETCIRVDAYYTFNWWISKYWQNFYQFQESLITNRRDSLYGWIDLWERIDCWPLSWTSLAFYRSSDNHTCNAWNCTRWSLSPTKYNWIYNTPVISLMDDTLFPEPWINRNVWIMVR